MVALAAPAPSLIAFEHAHHRRNNPERDQPLETQPPLNPGRLNHRWARTHSRFALQDDHPLNIVITKHRAQTIAETPARMP